MLKMKKFRTLMWALLGAVTSTLHAQEPCAGNRAFFVSNAGNDESSAGTIDSPYRTIQFAVQQACDGDSIIITPGFYPENVAILGKDLRIGGMEILDSNLLAPENVIIDGGDVATTFFAQSAALHLSGVTVQNGRSPYGAGIYLSYCSNSVIDACISRNNTGTGDITAHGIAVEGNNVVVSNSQVYENYGRKHVVNLNGSNVTFQNNIVRNNNTWEEGTVVVYSHSTRIVNCLIYGNNGGGVTTYRNDTEVIHSTIMNNSVHGLFTWSYGPSTRLKVSNSIIYGNGPSPSHNLTMSQNGATTCTMEFKHCILENLDDYAWLSVYKIITLDSTVFDMDPLIDAQQRLLPTSPAIGAGSSQITWSDGVSLNPEWDLDGNPRAWPVGSNPDLGCYESPLAIPNAILGCTNTTACNYDILAAVDDGTCILPSCSEPTACNYEPEGICFSDVCVYPGCMDNAACNFNSAAGCDDGSCIFAADGCTDNEACNFNANALCDDGSCDYSCCPGPGCCSSGMRWDVDQQRCKMLCQADLSGDGAINIGDLLMLLAVFETTCE
jgi:hypothetical protein